MEVENVNGNSLEHIFLFLIIIRTCGLIHTMGFKCGFLWWYNDLGPAGKAGSSNNDPLSLQALRTA